jgi:enoyl-CoA hydratase
MTAWGVESGHIDVAVQRDVAVVTLQRPEKLNALTAGMRRELAAILRHFGGGDPARGAGAEWGRARSAGAGRTERGGGTSRARGIVLTGAGRAFSAGEDLSAAAELPPGGLTSEIELFHDITRAALQTRVPVVAAINGIAVGGACEMTLCFDARIGTPAAEWFLPENSIGLTISNAASVLLPRLTGHRAMRLVLDSARISADEALAAGLLDEIVPETSLVETAIQLVRRWTEPGTATTEHLRLLRPSLAVIEQAFAAETEAARRADEAGLAQTGISRFLSRRRDTSG